MHIDKQLLKNIFEYSVHVCHHIGVICGRDVGMCDFLSLFLWVRDAVDIHISETEEMFKINTLDDVA